MLADKQGKCHILRIENQGLLEVANGTLLVVFFEEIRSRVQQPCEQVKVLATEAAKHVLYSLLELLLFTSLFAVFGNPIAPQCFAHPPGNANEPHTRARRAR